MLHITDTLIDRHVTATDAQAAMLDAFRSFGRGQAAMQERIRTEAGGVKLSTLGAVIPDQQVAGAKVYTTIAGQFSFVILLFSTVDGRPLASFDAGAITRLRTAACTVLAAKRLARPDAQTLALFGAGTQGVQHALQLSAALPLQRILICDPYADAEAATRLSAQCGVSVSFAQAEEAAAAADIIVTASDRLTRGGLVISFDRGVIDASWGSQLGHLGEAVALAFDAERLEADADPALEASEPASAQPVGADAQALPVDQDTPADDGEDA